MDKLWMLNRAVGDHHAGKVKTKKYWIEELDLSDEEWESMVDMNLFRQ